MDISEWPALYRMQRRSYRKLPPGIFRIGHLVEAEVLIRLIPIGKEKKEKHGLLHRLSLDMVGLTLMDRTHVRVSVS